MWYDMEMKKDDNYGHVQLFVIDNYGPVVLHNYGLFL